MSNCAKHDRLPRRQALGSVGCAIVLGLLAVASFGGCSNEALSPGHIMDGGSGLQVSGADDVNDRRTNESLSDGAAPLDAGSGGTSNGQPQDAGAVPRNAIVDASCRDECATGDRRCQGSNTVQVCGNSPGNSCLTFIDQQTCTGEGMVCRNGRCMMRVQSSPVSAEFFVDPGQICGGARRASKSSFYSSDQCSMPATSDNSCDRWGCARADDRGMAYCPTSTITVRTHDEPTYLVCLVIDTGNSLQRPEQMQDGEICGGARDFGKHGDGIVGGTDSCTMPETSDSTCDRWGCAVSINSQGDSDCPAGTSRVDISMVTNNTPLYFMCVVNAGGRALQQGPSDLKAGMVCGGWSKSNLSAWGCARDLACPVGTLSARVSDDRTGALCIVTGF